MQMELEQGICQSFLVGTGSSLTLGKKKMKINCSSYLQAVWPLVSHHNTRPLSDKHGD